jgi:thiol-disulfide isomerase/thioredoxin
VTGALVLVGKPGCHLCQRMREVAEPVAAELGLVIEDRDLRLDPELEALYRLDIPVLLLDGREVARHRVTAPDLRTRLREMAVGRAERG